MLPDSHTAPKAAVVLLVVAFFVVQSVCFIEPVQDPQIDAAAPVQAVATMVGKMQCANRDDAQKFDCFLPKDSCTCQPRETVAACQCEEQLLEHLFTLKEHILPLETHDILLKETGKTVEAQFKHPISLEAQVDRQGFQKSTIADKPTCEVTQASVSGCYNCLWSFSNRIMQN
ncbi:unnamed protein product [Toxocara canis]|uniref:Phlebovirus_G2 domain-containing protein n=1 Tax=Toxocara canis TaxID=6265 RepID=A0A183VF93_TOXCA|nr:unnamed protein product [Toxocara canis]